MKETITALVICGIAIHYLVGMELILYLLALVVCFYIINNPRKSLFCLAGVCIIGTGQQNEDWAKNLMCKLGKTL
jgi:hypothetical protein